MDSQQYSLKWNHHQSNLLKVFSRLLGNEQFTDVLLATEGKVIRCHKVVLSACSSYFENLFLAFDEKNQIVILKDTMYDDVSALVEFMYRGEINVAQGQLPSLLKTAENLKVKGLAEVTTSEANSEAADRNNGTVLTKSASLIPVPSSSTTSLNNNNSSSSSSNINNNSHSNKHHAINLSSENNLNLSGVTLPLIKRKRGRPRILDAPGEVNPFAPRLEDVAERLTSAAAAAATSSLDLVTSTNTNNTNGGTASTSTSKMTAASSSSAGNSHPPPPSEESLFSGDLIEPALNVGGPLTEAKIRELGVVKMNDYLASGTRQQFWEEYYVKVIMQAVRKKEIDMKTGAEILGVSYGTLYGRYRETFGYLKHAWNSGGRPSKSSSFFGGSPSMVPRGLPDMTGLLDPNSLQVLEQLKLGKITIRQAAELLKVEPALLAYEFAAKKIKVEGEGFPETEFEDEEDEDFHHDQMLEVQPDVEIRDDLNEESLDGQDQERSSSSPNQEPPRGSTSGSGGQSSVKSEDVDPIATNS